MSRILSFARARGHPVHVLNLLDTLQVLIVHEERCHSGKGAGHSSQHCKSCKSTTCNGQFSTNQTNCDMLSNHTHTLALFHERSVTRCNGGSHKPADSVFTLSLIDQICTVVGPTCSCQNQVGSVACMAAYTSLAILPAGTSSSHAGYRPGLSGFIPQLCSDEVTAHRWPSTISSCFLNSSKTDEEAANGRLPASSQVGGLEEETFRGVGCGLNTMADASFTSNARLVTSPAASCVQQQIMTVTKHHGIKYWVTLNLYDSRPSQSWAQPCGMQSRGWRCLCHRTQALTGSFARSRQSLPAPRPCEANLIVERLALHDLFASWPANCS